MHCSTALRARWHQYMATSLSSVTLIKAFIRGALRMPPTWTPCSETLLYVCLAGIVVTAHLTQSYTRTHTQPLRIIKLEQNYRSTAAILACAHAVIAASRKRDKKQLWTDNAQVGRGELTKCAAIV